MVVGLTWLVEDLAVVLAEDVSTGDLDTTERGSEIGGFSQNVGARDDVTCSNKAVSLEAEDSDDGQSGELFEG